MNKDEILVPILTAINDLGEEVRENRRVIRALENRMGSLEKRMESVEDRMERHEEQRKKE